MKKIYLFIFLFFIGCIIYISLAFANLRICSNDFPVAIGRSWRNTSPRRLKEQKMLLEKERRLLLIEIAEVASFKNFEPLLITALNDTFQRNSAQRPPESKEEAISLDLHPTLPAGRDSTASSSSLIRVSLNGKSRN